MVSWFPYAFGYSHLRPITQRQKSILEILLSKNEADYYYKKAEEKKKKIEANPLFS